MNTAAMPPESHSPAPFRIRWLVCGLLVLVAANTFFNRQAFGVLAPDLISGLGWTPVDYARVVFCFQLGFAVGYPLTGRIMDAVGPRRGLVLAVAVWSLAAGWHGALSSAGAFMVARFVFGLSQACYMPAGIKIIGDMFAPGGRALAIGVFKGGANFGVVLAPLALPWLYASYGWRASLGIVAATGAVWIALWVVFYRETQERGARGSRLAGFAFCRARKIVPAPLARQEPRAPRLSDSNTIPLRALLGRRQTWAYMNFKFMTDAVWQWYLAMLPLFLSQRFGLRLEDFGAPLVIVYAIGYAGSVGGGGLSSWLMARGWDVTRARKTAMFAFCALTVPVMLVTQLSNLWVCVCLIGLAHAAHQGLATNLFAVVPDIFPRQAVGTVVGLGGFAAQIGAMLMTLASGWWLHAHHHLTEFFFVAGAAYIVAFAIFHLLAPGLEPVDTRREPHSTM